MPAETINLPNLRKMFIPDPDFTIMEGDLARADAQVVTWESNDEELKEVFRSGFDIHIENAKVIYNLHQPSYEQRQKAKVGVHAVNYYVQARTLAAELGVTVHEAENFINRWFSAHPKIKKWHERIKIELSLTRSVTNKFGFRKYFFDKLDRLLPEALAWVPQSTVAIVTYHGMKNLARSVPEVEILLQVHDSLVMQTETKNCPTIFPRIKKAMEIPIPYDDPLTIPVGIEASEISWGDGVDVEKIAKARKAYFEGTSYSEIAASFGKKFKTDLVIKAIHGTSWEDFAP
jgi:DNA polymerase-1